MAVLIKVRIISSQKTIYEGSVVSISSKNQEGKFDILPQHANFITLVRNSPIILKLQDNKTTNFQFPLAIIYFSNNQASIYTEIS